MCFEKKRRLKTLGAVTGLDGVPIVLLVKTDLMWRHIFWIWCGGGLLTVNFLWILCHEPPELAGRNDNVTEAGHAAKSPSRNQAAHAGW